MSDVKLGKLTHTARGFELIDFKDANGCECSLQASSVALLAKPGTSAVWLGCDHEQVHNGERIGSRMHLNREQVEALIGHLSAWLKRDTFKLKGKR